MFLHHNLSEKFSHYNLVMIKLIFTGLLDKCTTKHEVQTLLQTKMVSGHMDANFNIAILDGHKVNICSWLAR